MTWILLRDLKTGTTEFSVSYYQIIYNAISRDIFQSIRPLRLMDINFFSLKRFIFQLPMLLRKRHALV